MAQDFERNTSNAVGTSAVTLRTANSDDAIVGITIANVTTSQITVEVYINDGALQVGSSDITLSGNIELGHASDTTIARSSAGVVTIEGNTILTTGNSDTPSTTTSSSDADFVLVDDGGTMKKITPSNLGITSGGASKGFAVAMAIAL